MGLFDFATAFQTVFRCAKHSLKENLLRPSEKKMDKAHNCLNMRGNNGCSGVGEWASNFALEDHSFVCRTICDEQWLHKKSLYKTFDCFPKYVAVCKVPSEALVTSILSASARFITRNFEYLKIFKAYRLLDLAYIYMRIKENAESQVAAITDCQCQKVVGRQLVDMCHCP